MKKRWYDQTPDILAKQLNTDLQTGLSKKEAASRLKRYGKNTIYTISRAPFKTYLLHIITDFMAVMLLLTAIISAIVSQSRASLVILAVLLCNYAITIVSYVKAQRVLEEMGHFSLPSAKVLRDGKLYLVKQERLVRGDVILVSAGDIVPCDARLVEDDGLFVLESGVCPGEKPVRKSASFVEHRMLEPGERKNMLFASTIVTEGKGRAVVCETGPETLVCTLGKNASVCDHEKLEVTASLRKYCSILNLTMMGGVFLITALRIFGVGHFSVFDTFMTGLSLSVSDMTELVSAFTYIIIASGIFTAVKRDKNINNGALIKNSAKISQLKDLDCLVIPKECLFSEHDMSVEVVYANGQLFNIHDSATKGVERVLRYALISTGIYGMQKLVANNDRGENVYTCEEEALIHAAERKGLYDRSLDENYPILDHVSAENGNGLDTTLVLHGTNYLSVLRGGAQSVLPRCSRYCENGKILPMDMQTRERFRITALQMMRGNNRVLAIASKRVPYNSLKKLGYAQCDLVFEGFVCLEEPLVPGAAKCISRCKADGIRVILFCKDGLENNRGLAISMGIAKNESECINLESISKMKEDLLRANLPMYAMYEGLNSNQQKRIMKWLREDYGYHIGVMGRELDDIVLFSEAEVGFSEVVTISERASGSGVDMTSKDLPVQVKNSRDGSRSGCEALKFVSDVVVSNPDKNGVGGFVSMVDAIATAKTVYRNLLTMMRYLVCSQVARLVVVLWSFISGIPYLSSPQILFLGLFSDMLAVIAIAFVKPNRDVFTSKENSEKQLERLPFDALKLLFPSLLWAILSLVQFSVYRSFGLILTQTQESSVLMITFLFAQLSVLSVFLLKRQSTFSGIRLNTAYLFTVVLLTLFLVCAYFLPQFGNLFGIIPFPSVCWIGIVSVSVLTSITVFLYRVISGKSGKKKGKSTETVL